jgi:hypothetical protein
LRNPTDPQWPDHDGDGYWDGWIGVYDVGYSDNVLLYRDNLPGGISGAHERVDEQVGTHGGHSNIHIGELHWRDYDPTQNPSPTNPSSEPDTSVTVEVDYHENDGIPGSQLQTVLDRAEYTYSLYGLDVTYEISEMVSDTESRWVRSDSRLSSKDCAPEGENWMEDESVHDTYHPQSSENIHMYFAWDGTGSEKFCGDVEGYTNSQVAEYNRDSQTQSDLVGYADILANDHNIDDSKEGDWSETTHLTKTVAHETAHRLGIGRLDDDGTTACSIETYSGGRCDDTPESIQTEDFTSEHWSAMTSGWQSPVGDSPMNDGYIAFSIEELLTTEYNWDDAS